MHCFHDCHDAEPSWVPNPCNGRDRQCRCHNAVPHGRSQCYAGHHDHHQYDHHHHPRSKVQFTSRNTWLCESNIHLMLDLRSPRLGWFSSQWISLISNIHKCCVRSSTQSGKFYTKCALLNTGLFQIYFKQCWNLNKNKLAKLGDAISKSETITHPLTDRGRC